MDAIERRDRLEQFVEMASGPVEIVIRHADGHEERVEMVSGRLDGGWVQFDGHGGIAEHGEFYKEPNGPLETITCERHG